MKALKKKKCFEVVHTLLRVLAAAALNLIPFPRCRENS